MGLLTEHGIDEPSELVNAFQVNDDLIVAVVADYDGGSHLDAPNVDHSGENAWEWIEFRDGHERNLWLEEGEFTETDFLVERYEHGQVNYGLCCYPGSGLPGDPRDGESSPFDRQWDVAPGVAVIRFTKPEEFGRPLVDVARGILEEYTSWCNGDCYGLIRYERMWPAQVWHPPGPRWEETESCWGFLGYDYAINAAKAGDV